MVTFTEIAALAVAVEIIVTVLKQRAPGMSLNRIPLFVWAMLVTSFMIVFAMPAVMAASSFLIMDRLIDTHFFNPAEGGDALLWQHLFWFFGHPEVYIIFLPALGWCRRSSPPSPDVPCSAIQPWCWRWSRPPSSVSACGCTTCSQPACLVSATASTPPPA
jgi:hypothetical protein